MTAMELHTTSDVPMVQGGFDYSQLDESAASIARQLAKRIQYRNVAMAQSYIDNGKDLIAAKERIPRGQWLNWLNIEFTWSQVTASRMMKVAELFGHLELATSQVTGNALALLSQYDISESIRQDASTLIMSGEITTASDVVSFLEERDAAASKRIHRSQAGVVVKENRQVVHLLALQVAELGFAVRNMQVALSDSYGLPFRSPVADALGRLQTVADVLIRLVPEDRGVGEFRQGVKRRGTSSHFVGVSFYSARGMWRASISAEGKMYTIGYYDTEEDAARAYDAKARELYGDTARLNFPDA